MRTLALVAAMTALTLSPSVLAAQSSANQQPASKPATSHASDTAKKASTSATATSTTKQASWTKEEVKEAQEGLAKEGLYKGKVDGTFNADTHKALKEYQKKNKMPVTGQLDDNVLAKLKSA